jgi:hypothetical protein
VDFSPGASPGNLLGGSSIGFQVTAGFLADSDAPPPQKGVNPNETLGVVFDLQTGASLANVIADLTNGQLRIGIHVQAFAGGGSESFVNVAVPEPRSGLLIVAGLLADGAPTPMAVSVRLGEDVSR